MVSSPAQYIIATPSPTTPPPSHQGSQINFGDADKISVNTRSGDINSVQMSTILARLEAVEQENVAQGARLEAVEQENVAQGARLEQSNKRTPC